MPEERADRAPAWRRPTVIVGAVIVVLVVAFALANRSRVEVDYLVVTRRSRLIFVILGSAVLGALADRLLVWRRHRAED